MKVITGNSPNKKEKRFLSLSFENIKIVNDIIPAVIIFCSLMPTEIPVKRPLNIRKDFFLMSSRNDSSKERYADNDRNTDNIWGHRPTAYSKEKVQRE